MPAKSGSGRFRGRQLNPAFAAAHSLTNAGSQPKSKDGRNANSSANNHQVPGGNHLGGQRKVEGAVRAARSSGRLNLSNCQLHTLPEAIWDLRQGVEVDLSLDRDSNPGSWESFGEEEITTVDLSDNEISGQLDERIERFKAVKTFRARRCNIQTIPWRVLGGLDSLTVLDLSGNNIQSVPLEFLPMTLREVDFSSNSLTSLTGEEDEREVSEAADTDVIIVLPNLVRLDVSDNDLTALPPMEVQSLHTFRFGKNAISAIPDDFIIQTSRSLSTLEGAGNKISTVPDLSGCKSLRIVDLCDNLLQIPPSIHSSLVRLSLANNSIESISGLFSEAQRKSAAFRSELTELRLRRNKISSLDETVLKSLTKVNLIDAGENDLRDVPRVLGYLPQLRRMPLDGNPFRAIRPPLAENTNALKQFLRKRGPPPPGPDYLASEVEEIACGTSAPTNEEAKSMVGSALGGSHTLDLCNKQLSRIPDQLENELMAVSAAEMSKDGPPATLGSRVKALVVSKNVFTEFGGEWIDYMPRLSVIDASQNRLESLPRNLSEASLTELRLARNRLVSSAIASSALCLSAGEGDLARSLVHLDLSSNAMEWFPSGLCDLPSLSTLLLSHNKISTLAHSDRDDSGWRCPGFPSLETLDLSNNKISNLGDLPLYLGGCCPMLRALMLQNNEISSIPPTLGLLESLNRIDLRGNPQRGIRIGILDRSCDAILNYLASRMEASEMEGAKEKVAEMSSRATQSRGGAGESQIAPALDTHSDRAAGREKAKQTPSLGASPLVEDLREQIDQLALELNKVHLTEAQKYAMKKKLAMKKAELIRAERRLAKG